MIEQLAVTLVTNTSSRLRRNLYTRRTERPLSLR